GALLRLAFPSAESGAVVVQHELHSAIGHCLKATGTGGSVKQRRTTDVTRPIDFASDEHSHFARHSAPSLPQASRVRSRTPRPSMPPRTLASLPHALTVAGNRDAALEALGEALAEVDRYAHLGLVRFDARRAMLVERILVVGSRTDTLAIETTFDHIATRERMAISAGGQFVDFGDNSEE